MKKEMKISCTFVNEINLIKKVKCSLKTDEKE